MERKSVFPKSRGRPAKQSNEVPRDSWQALDKVLHASLRENVRARRWRIFFRLAWLAVVVWLSVAMIRALDFANQDFEIPFYVQEEGEIDADHVALIEIKGVILSDLGAPSRGVVQYEQVAAALQRAFENEQAKAVVLEINSPGGNPTTSSYIYNEIVKWREAEPDKQVYAIITDLGVSAAYHIASAADEIYCHATSLVGSIGVISASFGFDELIENYGIERRVYYAGRNKAMLDPFSPLNPEHEEQLQHILEVTHESFIADVMAGRGNRLDQYDRSIFSGIIYSAEQAMTLGLVDGLGFLDEIVAERTGLDNLVNYSLPEDPFQRIISNLGASLSAAVGSQFWSSLTSQSYQRH